jgi:DNA-binding response OmpR family regulator
MQDHHVDLVITDWRMPGLSGTELGDILNRSKRPPPIILMTGHPSAGLTYRAVHDHKFAAIFSKPFEPDEMAAKVLGLLADSMGYDPSAQAAPEPRQAAGGRRLGRA